MTPRRVPYGGEGEASAAGRKTRRGTCKNKPERLGEKSPEPPLKRTAGGINKPTQRFIIQAQIPPPAVAKPLLRSGRRMLRPLPDATAMRHLGG
jgi:hypothetical protein